MAANLRDRLKRIQAQKKGELSKAEPTARVREKQGQTDISVFTENGWQPCGFKVMKREVIPVVKDKTIAMSTPFEASKSLPASLAVVVPDLAKFTSSNERLDISSKDFLFFDLETTGLSGGAGTVAFLAAFGRFASSGKLHITQYLLLDYSGENDFLETVLAEFTEQAVIVSYNGKCFDSQILKTRCLMNRIKPPVYHHADLLHPARRLWKNIIQDCSQASVEARVLGIDRSDDIPGALAPEIWFEFLKTDRTDRLFGICEHNTSDIYGLAIMLSAMVSIAQSPLDAEYIYDIERLALYWRDYLRYKTNTQIEALRITGQQLLHFAAEKYPRAAFVLARDQLYGGNCEEGQKRLWDITRSDFSDKIKAQAIRALSIFTERKLKDITAAFELAKQGLELEEVGRLWHEEFKRRAERLEKKLSR